MQPAMDGIILVIPGVFWHGPVPTHNEFTCALWRRRKNTDTCNRVTFADFTNCYAFVTPCA